MVRVRVLGQLAPETGGTSADLGGHQQRAVLARPLVARGSVVSADRMIDDLWRGEPPPRAIASLQAYVSNLRRVLEPGRPPRSPARLLITAPPGYAFRADDGAVDAWRFEQLVRAAQSVAPKAPASARLQLVQALRLWQGSAYAEFADEPWAANEAIRIEEVRRIATESLVTVALRSGQPAEAVALAEMLVNEHPLRQESWRLLAVALWGNNRSSRCSRGIATGPRGVRRSRDLPGERVPAHRMRLDRGAAGGRAATHGSDARLVLQWRCRGIA